MTGKRKCYPIFRVGKEEGNYVPVSLTSVLRKIVEQFLMKTVYWHMKNKNLKSQHGSTESKSCLTILVDFYDEMTGFVDEWRGMGDVHFDFRKAFGTVLRITLVAKLRRCELDGCTTK